MSGTLVSPSLSPTHTHSHLGRRLRPLYLCRARCSGIKLGETRGGGREGGREEGRGGGERERERERRERRRNGVDTVDSEWRCDRGGRHIAALVSSRVVLGLGCNRASLRSDNAYSTPSLMRLEKRIIKWSANVTNAVGVVFFYEYK